MSKRACSMKMSRARTRVPTRVSLWVYLIKLWNDAVSGARELGPPVNGSRTGRTRARGEGVKGGVWIEASRETVVRIVWV